MTARERRNVARRVNRRRGRPRYARDRCGRCVCVALEEATRIQSAKFASALARVMREEHIAPSELAAAIGTGVTIVFAWLRGDRLPRFARVCQVAMAMRRPIDHLTG